MPTAAQKAAAAKKAGAKIVDFDAERKKKVKKRYQWKALGRVWSLKRPNVFVMGELEDMETIGSFINYILQHVDKADREDFVAAFSAEEDLDYSDVADLAASMQKVVYADIPQSPS